MQNSFNGFTYCIKEMMNIFIWSCQIRVFLAKSWFEVDHWIKHGCAHDFWYPAINEFVRRVYDVSAPCPPEKECISIILTCTMQKRALPIPFLFLFSHSWPITLSESKYISTICQINIQRNLRISQCLENIK